jgi:hypothetical protein
MKKFCLLLIIAFCAVLTVCENRWMNDITKDLFPNNEKNEGEDPPPPAIEPPSYIGVSSWEELTAIIYDDNVTKETIQIIESFSFPESIYIAPGKNITLISGGNRTLTRQSGIDQDFSFFSVGGGTLQLGLAGMDGKLIFSGSGTNIETTLFFVTAGELIINDNAELSGNRANAGAGVFLFEGGCLTMNGGSISGNEATYIGGGVYVGEGSSFTMTGGSIGGNKANLGGGVIILEGGSFIKTGGTIYGNNGGNNANIITDGGTGAAVMAGNKVRETTAGDNINLNTDTDDNWEFAK